MRRSDRYLRAEQEPVFEEVRIPRSDRAYEDPGKAQDLQASIEEAVYVATQQRKTNPPLGLFYPPFEIVKDPWD
jgi:hypothetical protein